MGRCALQDAATAVPMLLRSAVAVASAALVVVTLLPVGAVPSVSGSGSSSGRGENIPPPALRCGGNGDPSTDSSDVLDLYGFIRAVCCDQLGEKLSQNMPNLLMPDTCTTAGGLFFFAPHTPQCFAPCRQLLVLTRGACRAMADVAGCAHTVDLVANACLNDDGRWDSGFLGAAFGMQLDSTISLCAAQMKNPWPEDGVFAITSNGMGARECSMGKDCIALGPGSALPLYIIDGTEELQDGAADCHTCDLGENALSSCTASCMQPGQDGVAPADYSAGQLCSPGYPCGAGTFCDYGNGVGVVVYPHCRACSSCAAERWADGSNTSRIDQLSVHAPGALTIQLTLQALYLPDHAELRIEPKQPTSADAPPLASTVLRGKHLPNDASQRVIEVDTGEVRVGLLSDNRDVSEPATFILQIDMLCTLDDARHSGCGAHGDCGTDRRCQCHYGYVGHACLEYIG